MDHYQRVAWIQQLAPWTVMATFTWRWEASIWSAQRCFERFMRRRLPGVSYVEAIEQNPGRDGYHVHSLWADCQTVYRKEMWHSWLRRYGRARIEPVRHSCNVSDYASKYLLKADCWFEVKLQSWRVDLINKRPLQLSAGGVLV
jgi:hypothetical protein